MTEFQTGDRVLVLEHATPRLKRGEVGTVRSTDRCKSYPILVEFGPGDTCPFKPNELELFVRKSTTPLAALEQRVADLEAAEQHIRLNILLRMLDRMEVTEFSVLHLLTKE